SGIVLELMILLIPALMYAKIKGQGYSAKMNFASLRPTGSILALCALIIALTGVILIAMGYTATGIAHSKYLLSDTYGMLLPDSEQDVFLRCMNYALIPAVAEEILYRGILVTEYSESGVGHAVFFSSLLYALSSFNALEAPVYFFIGVIFALTYYVTRSLPLTIITRLIFNLLIFYFEDAAWTLILKNANSVFLFCFCLILLLAAAVLALSEAQRLYYTRGIDGEKAPAEWSPGESLKARILTATLSPTFMLCIGIFVAVIIGM
ncbi:MAG: CPBP family intramembrane metalloprotease, partial [Clostridia bacterium]|nr:CPBP family intramembrane metalloprotease [Clostridia bacterium]